MSLVLSGSSQSASFECQYETDEWGTFGTIYQCEVQNAVNITSLNEAQVVEISGTHKAGYNNDKVEAFDINQKGQINYFPRGLNKFFKNLKGISFAGTGLKEIHQSDLKVFPHLKNLYLWSNNLEILEENLFEFNPNLELINLNSNKISHIDPKLFDKLTKLKTLTIESSICINMYTSNNPTAVKNIIKAAKAKCINSDYLNLAQKVKSIEIESENLNSENLKEKLENLENEVKKSKFSNTFKRRLQDLKAIQVIKAEEENTTALARKVMRLTCSNLESKVDKIATNLKDLIPQSANGTCSANRGQDIDQREVTNLETLKENVENLKTSSLEETKQIKNSINNMEKKIEELSQKFEDFEKKLIRIMRGLYMEV